MAGASITISGVNRTTARVKRIVPEVERSLRDTLVEQAREVVVEAQTQISAPKSGKLYRAKRRGTSDYYTWRASAPGEAPAKRTGENRNKIKAKRWNRKEKPGAKIQYPNIYRMLERGKSGNRAISPRPLFQKIIAERRARVLDAVEGSVKRVLGTKIRRK